MTRGWGGTAESKQRTPRVRWYVWRAKFCPFKTVFLLRISYQIITNDYKPVKIKYFLSLKKRDFKVRRKKSRLLLMVYLHLHVSQWKQKIWVLSTKMLWWCIWNCYMKCLYCSFPEVWVLGKFWVCRSFWALSCFCLNELFSVFPHYVYGSIARLMC